MTDVQGVIVVFTNIPLHFFLLFPLGQTEQKHILTSINILNYLPIINQLLQEGGPLPGPKHGLLSNTWKWNCLRKH